jgi:hypothetical protein
MRLLTFITLIVLCYYVVLSPENRHAPFANALNKEYSLASSDELSTLISSSQNNGIVGDVIKTVAQTKTVDLSKIESVLIGRKEWSRIADIHYQSGTLPLAKEISYVQRYQGLDKSDASQRVLLALTLHEQGFTQDAYHLIESAAKSDKRYISYLYLYLKYHGCIEADVFKGMTPYDIQDDRGHKFSSILGYAPIPMTTLQIDPVQQSKESAEKLGKWLSSNAPLDLSNKCVLSGS